MNCSIGKFSVLAALTLFYSITVASICYSEPIALETIVVNAKPYKEDVIPEKSLVQSGDPAASLEKISGAYLATGGGVSSLPVVKGLNDDRLNTVVNGTQITSACANHMNPSLSYVDPFFGSQLQLKSGLPSVADFGDAIGETITLTSAEPKFSASSDSIRSDGAISSLYRSNGDGLTESVRAEAASDDTYVSYAGSYNKSNSYNDGNGRKVYSTQFEAITNSLNISKRFDNHLTTLNLSTQKVPYQGFPNQYMDMTDNLSTTVSALDKAKFDWGTLDSTIFLHNTDHVMGFFSREKQGKMPMNTEGTDYGYSFKGEVPVGNQNHFRLGTDLHRFELDDTWPAVPGSMMMGPHDYININSGHKQVIGNYAEYEFRPTKEWTTQAGVRYNLVQMNTGDVRSYTEGSSSGGGMGGMDMGMHSARMDMGMSDSDVVAAQMFNQRDRSQIDNNIDLNLQAKYEPDLRKSIEFGYTRKVRSPNLYERYAWGRGTMAATMIGWYGDANGYVGDIDLKPEVAHTLSTTISFNDPSQDIWTMSATPYASYVEEFIDADSIGTFNPRMDPRETRQLLQFANHDARLYGFDVDGSARVVHDNSLGDVSLYSVVGMVRGTRVDTGSNLYRMMPINARVGAEHTLGGWESSIELKMTASKSKTDPIRDEPETPGFAIVNLQTGYAWKSTRVDFGITNLFDTYYELPLGGVDYSDFASGQRESIGGLPGAGRSLNVGVTYLF